MFIENIKINNFRNIENENFQPSERINILFGDNANGKTSFIESIYSISNLKSFRTKNLNETIKSENFFSEILCNYVKNDCRENINLRINKSSKEYLKNDKKCKIDEYLWSLFSIVFKPDDINIINGSPILRREFIDKAIFYIDKNYINLLKKYHKILSNKNINLKNESLNELKEWNTLIAKYSAQITEKRINYIKELNNLINNKGNEFNYNFEITSDYFEYIGDIEKIYIKELNKNLEKEIKYKYSVVGSHRENISVNIDKKDLKVYGSQGQKRTFILLFRASQIENFYNINGFYPILLLDDMASELDDNNKNIFLNLIENFSGQTFITTTDKSLYFKSDKVESFRVSDGKIVPLHK